MHWIKNEEIGDFYKNNNIGYGQPYHDWWILSLRKKGGFEMTPIILRYVHNVYLNHFFLWKCVAWHHKFVILHLIWEIEIRELVSNTRWIRYQILHHFFLNIILKVFTLNSSFQDTKNYLLSSITSRVSTDISFELAEVPE